MSRRLDPKPREHGGRRFRNYPDAVYFSQARNSFRKRSRRGKGRGLKLALLRLADRPSAPPPRSRALFTAVSPAILAEAAE